MSKPHLWKSDLLKKLTISTALSGALIGAAVAQTNPGMPPAPAPKANMPAASSGPAVSNGAQIVNAQQADQWLSSNFIGVDVVGPDNAKIGDVSDVLFEKNGQVVAYVVGVGGFLGIGAKNVALAPASFQVVPANEGTTGSAAATADDIKLRLNMTKEQLKQAASFESKRELDAKTRAASQPSGANRPVTAPPR